MKFSQKVGLLCGSLLLSLGASFAQADTATMPQVKVAIVNVQQLLQQSPRVAALSKRLEGEFKDRQTKISDEQKSLQDAVDKFKKDSVTMGTKERDATQKKITADRSELVKKVVAYQQDLQKEQNKVMQNVLNDLNGIVSTIAKKESFALVLDSQAVIFSSDGTDITKDVEKRFNDKG